MKKIVLLSALTLSIAVHSVVNAAPQNTISLGYAQSDTGIDGKSLSPLPPSYGVVMDAAGLEKDLKGANIKYRYEFDSRFGVITGITYTKKGNMSAVGASPEITVTDKLDLKYYSLMVGPTFRFNDYISLYATIGAAHTKAEFDSVEAVEPGSELTSSSRSVSANKTAFAYGIGFQVNPIPNLAIDASYEYSKLNGAVPQVGDAKVGTWVLGVGYSF